MKLTPLAVDNLDLLHKIAEAGPETTFTGIAGDLGRDQSNVSKTVAKLRGEGVVAEGMALTEAGRAVTRMLAADGELQVAGEDVLRLPGQLVPDPDNERKHFAPGEIEEMMHSLLSRGQLQELTIRRDPAGGCDLIVYGERRWRGAGLAIERRLWAPDRPLRCRLISEADAHQLTLIRMAENLQRRDLHPLDEGAGYVKLRDRFGMKPAEIAAEVGRSPKHVADYIRLVEHLSETDQARMYLAPDHADHLNYAEARRIVQGMNARPKPAVDVDPTEALLLIEIGARAAAQPSRDALARGDGWTRIESAAAMLVSAAAASLAAKGLIETRAHRDVAYGYVRIAPDKAIDVRHWLAERGEPTMSLWSARVAVVGAGVTASLASSGRYATPWLNDPLPEPDPPPPSVPDAAPTAAHLAPPPAPAAAAPLSSTEGDDEAPVPDYLRRLAGPGADDPEPRSSTVAETTGEGDRAGAAGVVEGAQSPQSPADAPTFPELTPARQTMLAEIADKIAREPVKIAATGRHGARAYDFWHDADAQVLMHARLVRFGPAPNGDGQLVTLTQLGDEWCAFHAEPITAAGPYATPWLNPPNSSTVAKTTGEADRPPQADGGGGAAAAADTPHAFFAKPYIPPTWRVVCGNCEEDFHPPGVETDEIVDGPRFYVAGQLAEDVIDAELHAVPDAARLTCPHCQAELIPLAAEIYFIRRGAA